MRWRDVLAGELRSEHVGQRLALAGWARAGATMAASSSSTCAMKAASRSS
jgi:hypothetical protein